MKWIKNSLKPYAKLPTSIYVMFFASLINYLGNFVSPFLTLFLTRKAGIGIDIVGIIVAINALAGMLGTMIGGKLIDHLGRKKILMIFRTASAIGYGLCAFIHNPAIIAFVLITANFLGGFSEPVYGTIITDLTNSEQRQAAFSLSYISLNIGYSIATLLAGFLYAHHTSILFLGDAGTTLISVLLLSIFVPETMPDKATIKSFEHNTNEKGEKGSIFSVLTKKTILLKFSFAIVIYYIVFSQFTFGLPLQVTDVFKAHGALLYGSLITINAVMCSTLTVFIGSATKNIGASFAISIGGFLYFLGFGMLFFISSYPMFIVSTMLWTIGEILVTTNTNVFVANHTPVTHRGRFNAIMPVIRKAGFMTGPMLGGVFVDNTGIRTLWLLVGGMALIGALVMYILSSHEA